MYTGVCNQNCGENLPPVAVEPGWQNQGQWGHVSGHFGVQQSQEPPATMRDHTVVLLSSLLPTTDLSLVCITLGQKSKILLSK